MSVSGSTQKTVYCSSVNDPDTIIPERSRVVKHEYDKMSKLSSLVEIQILLGIERFSIQNKASFDRDFNL
jgi:hypothetical protein